MDREQIEKISKALADETRLQIYEAIASRSEITCGDIVNLQEVSPATISHHLKILQEAGLIECVKQGQFVHSRVAAGTIREYAGALQRIARVTGKRVKRSRQSPTKSAF
jgi:ArsR family transcriptional regulator